MRKRWKRCWKTVFKVFFFPCDATITQAETTAALEATRAVCSLVHSGCSTSDLDGNFVEDWDENDKANRKLEERSHER